jgi:hypothetical protein
MTFRGAEFHVKWFPEAPVFRQTVPFRVVFVWPSWSTSSTRSLSQFVTTIGTYEPSDVRAPGEEPSLTTP